MASPLKTSVVLVFFICFTFMYFDFDKKIQEIRRIYQEGHNSNSERTAIMNDTVKTKSQRKPHHGHCNVIDLTASNTHNFQCLTMKTDPPAPICIHDLAKDKYISGSLSKSGYWERSLVSEVMNALRTNPEIGLIDIGANIGAFSLLAAKAGHTVVAVEPIMDNILRLHKAAQLGNTTDRITLIHNAIANVRTWGKSHRNPTNVGGSPVELGTGEKCQGNCALEIVNTIFMDDLLEVITFKKAVIKIDCEGCEHRAFDSGQKLMDTLNVTAIIMEWKAMPRLKEKDQELVEKMMSLFESKGFKPHKIGKRHGPDLDIAQWRSWPIDVAWFRE